MDTLRFLNVVCEDIDGGDCVITIATFNVIEAKAAVDLLAAISKYNGSVRIEYEEFMV